MKTSLKHIKKGFTLVELLVVIAIMGALGAVGYGAILAFMNSGDKQAAETNMSNTGKALTQFSKDNKAFPCDTTADKLQDKAGAFGELQGDTANCYLRQLFAKKDVVEEKNFFAKIGEAYSEGDGNIANGACLEPGENAFAYVMLKADESATPKSKAKPAKNKKAAAVEITKRPVREASAPLMFCCIKHDGATPIPGEELLLDMDPFNEFALVLKANGSVEKLEGDKITVDPNDESVGTFAEGKTPFPKSRSTGESKAADYIILPPAL